MISTLPIFDSLLNMKGPSRPSKWPSNKSKRRNRSWPNAGLKLSKRSPRQKERLNPFKWWPRDRPRPMMPYHGRSPRSWCSTKASTNGTGFYPKSLEEPYPSLTWARWVACRAARRGAQDKSSETGFAEIGSKRMINGHPFNEIRGVNGSHPPALAFFVGAHAFNRRIENPG